MKLTCGWLEEERETERGKEWGMKKWRSEEWEEKREKGESGLAQGTWWLRPDVALGNQQDNYEISCPSGFWVAKKKKKKICC